ncbi:hypothetical protein D932_01943 [Enterococcus casseliflavus 14-MB-W-14]|nr:hypothetical protein D932_01943 [Enterococcus casseliflavus 14-MB-W-14]
MKVGDAAANVVFLFLFYNKSKKISSITDNNHVLSLCNTL